MGNIRSQCREVTGNGSTREGGGKKSNSQPSKFREVSSIKSPRCHLALRRLWSLSVEVSLRVGCSSLVLAGPGTKIQLSTLKIQRSIKHQTSRARLRAQTALELGC